MTTEVEPVMLENLTQKQSSQKPQKKFFSNRKDSFKGNSKSGIKFTKKTENKLNIKRKTVRLSTTKTISKKN